MGVGAAGTWAIEILGVVDFLGEKPLNYCQLPKTIDL